MWWYSKDMSQLLIVPHGLTYAVISSSVTDVRASLGTYMRNIVFLGDAPATWTGYFAMEHNVTVYYPADSATWTDSTMMNFGYTVAYCTALPELIILEQPEMQQSVKGNETFEVRVIAHGSGLTYLWQMSGRDGNWADVPDSNSAILTMPAANLGSYIALRCIVTDENGNTVVSDQANVDIHPVVEFGSNLNELHLVNVESSSNVYLNFTPAVDGEYIFHFSCFLKY